MSKHCSSTSSSAPRWAALLAIVMSFAATPAQAAAQGGATSPLQTASAEHNETDEMRLARIGYRLAKANSDRCAQPEMLTGLMLHDIAGYDPADRPTITSIYGLGRGFGVLSLIPASSAERAGIKPGDEILSINGFALDQFESGLIGTQASYDRTEKFVDLLDHALLQGPAALTMRRGAEQFSLELAGEPGCGGRFVVMPGRNLNAWADGRYVAVTSRMMDFAKADEELAFVVAHEMAHNILNHAGQLNGTSNLLALFGFGSGKVKRTEMEADAFAVELMSRTRFDLSAPERFLRHSSKGRWFDLSLTHPTASRRIEIVNTVIAGLEAEHASDRTPTALAVLMAGRTFDGTTTMSSRDTAQLWAEAGWATITLEAGEMDRPALASSEESGSGIPEVAAMGSLAMHEPVRIEVDASFYSDWQPAAPRAVPLSVFTRQAASNLAILRIAAPQAALQQLQSCSLLAPQTTSTIGCAAWNYGMLENNEFIGGEKRAETSMLSNQG